MALSIRSDHKHLGVSWELLAYVARYAECRGFDAVESIESRDNHSAIELQREMGFTVTPCPDDANLVLVRRQLGGGYAGHVAHPVSSQGRDGDMGRLLRAVDVMSTNIVTIGPDTEVSDIAKLLVAQRFSAVPVVDAEARPVGLVSEGDLLGCAVGQVSIPHGQESLRALARRYGRAWPSVSISSRRAA